MKRLFIMFILSYLGSCKTKEPVIIKSTAPVIVYKTKADFSNLVPIRFADDKELILSFPAPQDLLIANTYLKPIALKDGYWLDQQGVDVNSAFLKWTYQEYVRFAAVPGIEQLKASVVEANPFLEIYYCGRVHEFEDLVGELNEKIRNKQLDQFRRLN